MAPGRIRIGPSEMHNEVELSMDGKVLLHIVPKRPFPVSYPEFIIFCDSEGKEICMIKDYTKLDEDSRESLDFVLEKLYFIPRIVKIFSLRTSGDEFQWEVLTNRGRRSFSTRGRHNVFSINPKVVMIDTEGNVYVIPDREKLDKKSRFLLSSAV